MGFPWGEGESVFQRQVRAFLELNRQHFFRAGSQRCSGLGWGFCVHRLCLLGVTLSQGVFWARYDGIVLSSTKWASLLAPRGGADLPSENPGSVPQPSRGGGVGKCNLAFDTNASVLVRPTCLLTLHLPGHSEPVTGLCNISGSPYLPDIPPTLIIPRSTSWVPLYSDPGMQGSVAVRTITSTHVSARKWASPPR